MFARCFVRGFLPLCLATALVGCSNSGLDFVQVTPGTQSVPVGQTAQFTAMEHTATRTIRRKRILRAP